MVRDRAESLSRKLQPEVARLRKLLADIDAAPLGPWGPTKWTRRSAAWMTSRMLEQGDLDEARAMAEEAGTRTWGIEGELRSEEQASRWGQRVRIGRSRARAEQARNLAGEIEAEIARRCPIPKICFRRRSVVSWRTCGPSKRRCGDGVARSARVRQARTAAQSRCACD